MILAQVDSSKSFLVFALLAGLMVFLFMTFSLTLVVAKCYKRCPSNRALVIYGRTDQNRAARVMHGGAAFVLPLLQDYAYLSLELIPFELQTKGVLLADGPSMNVTTALTVAISTEPKVLDNAATRLLGLPAREIQQCGEEIIAGPLRQLLGGMAVRELRSGHDEFQERLLQAVERKLNEIGLVLTSANIREVTASP